MFARLMFRMFLTRWGCGCHWSGAGSYCGCWYRRCCCWSDVHFRLFNLDEEEKTLRFDDFFAWKFTWDNFDNSCCNWLCNARTSSRGNCMRSWSFGNKRMLCRSNWRICSIWWNASSRCWTARFFSCSSWRAIRRLSSASRRQCSHD